MFNIDEIVFYRENHYLQYPKILQIEITNVCPLNCPQCYKETKANHISFNVFCDTLRKANDMGVKAIMLNGGEPFCHPHIVDMLLELKKYNFYAATFSSGVGITQAIAKKIKNVNFDLLLSLNGSTYETNQKSRDGFYHTLSAAAILKSEEMDFGINWVARKDNTYDFENMLILMDNIGASYINVVCNKLNGDGEIDSKISIEEYIYLRDIIKKNSDKNIQIQNCYNTLRIFCGYDKNIKFAGCSAGISLCNVTASGNFMPCTHFYHEESYTSLYDYWHNSDFLKKLRLIRNEKCDFDCEYKKECFPCYAMNKEYYESFDIKNFQCPIMPNMEVM